MKTAGQIPPEAARQVTVSDQVQAVSPCAGGWELYEECCISE